jgi:hypothetical protein
MKQALVNTCVLIQALLSLAYADLISSTFHDEHLHLLQRRASFVVNGNAIYARHTTDPHQEANGDEEDIRPAAGGSPFTWPSQVLPTHDVRPPEPQSVFVLASSFWAVMALGTLVTAAENAIRRLLQVHVADANELSRSLQPADAVHVHEDQSLAASDIRSEGRSLEARNVPEGRVSEVRFPPSSWSFSQENNDADSPTWRLEELIDNAPPDALAILCGASGLRITYVELARHVALVASVVAFFIAAVVSSEKSLPAASISSTVSICTFFATSAKAAMVSATISACEEAKSVMALE